METPSSYCEAILHLDKAHLQRLYHDTAYGFPITEDNELFERLVLEINQAGLSWITILNKQENFRKAYHNFNIKKVAIYDESDQIRLLNDAGIIRNRLKINAAIHNANVIIQLQNEFGSFKKWLDSHHPKEKKEWVKLFKQTFKFTGGEIVNEFLQSIGYLDGAHIPICPVYEKVLQAKPPWNN